MCPREWVHSRENIMNCICGENNFNIISERVRDSINFKVLECRGCGLMQLSPRPSINEDENFYDSNCQSKNIKDPTDLKSIISNSLHDTNRRAELVSKYIKNSDNMLDIGSGYGCFLQEMSIRGYNITGIEISKEKRKISSKVSNIKVMDINLNEDNKDLPVFDCITLFYVLEHIIDPIQFLKVIKKHLNNIGKLIIEVPNVDGMILNECRQYKDFLLAKSLLILI